MKLTNNSFAEVIKSSLTGFVAQSWQWDYCPTFGSLVLVQDDIRTLFGVVHQVETGSIDPVRSPFPYQKTLQELKKEQPHIFEFLKTTDSCLTVGYRQGSTVVRALAPEPPKIHAFVSPASRELAQQFFSSADYLHLLFGMQSQLFNLDELLLALLRYSATCGCTDKQRLRAFMDTYVLLTGNEYRRVKLFAQRVQSALELL